MVGKREGRRQAQSAARLLELFIGTLEGWLDDQLDRRLVRTFFLAMVAMVRLPHNRSGQLLSELGPHILPPVPDGPKMPAPASRPPAKLAPQNRKAVSRRRDTAPRNQVSFRETLNN